MVENGTGNHPDAVEEARAFLRQRDSIRKVLREERDRVAERLREIDATLREIGDESAPPPQAFVAHRQVAEEPRAVPLLDKAKLKKASAPSVVKAILRAHPEGLTAAQLLEEVSSIKPNVDAPLLHSTLYRAQKINEIRREGNRGARTYFFVKDNSEVTDEDE